MARATITSGETTLQGLRLLLQSWVGSYANHVLDAEKLAEFIKQWQSKTCVSAQQVNSLSFVVLFDERFDIREKIVQVAVRWRKSPLA